jgi:hypothetical protein
LVSSSKIASGEAVARDKSKEYIVLSLVDHMANTKVQIDIYLHLHI